MEQITAETERGWTKEFPTVPGFYFVRTEQYRELPAEFDGRAVSGLYGTRFFPDDLPHHHPEFLGPFTASDTEQLIRLREACEAARAWICRVSNQYMFFADDPHEALAKLNAVLNPKSPQS